MRAAPAFQAAFWVQFKMSDVTFKALHSMWQVTFSIPSEYGRLGMLQVLLVKQGHLVGYWKHVFFIIVASADAVFPACFSTLPTTKVWNHQFCTLAKFTKHAKSHPDDFLTEEIRVLISFQGKWQPDCTSPFPRLCIT